MQRQTDNNIYPQSAQYRWGHPLPSRKSRIPVSERVSINGKCKPRADWRESREARKRKAFQHARTVQHFIGTELLSQTNVIVFTGNLMMPNQDQEKWRTVKLRFGKLVRMWAKTHGCQLTFTAAQHITKNRADNPQSFDDMHFDLLGYIDNGITQRRLSNVLCNLWRDAGGKRASFHIIEDRNEANIERVCNYLFKFPDTQRDQETFDRFQFLPKTRFPVTWTVGNFYRRESMDVELEFQVDGQHVKTQKRLSPFEQVRQDWIASFTNGNPVRIETPQYRRALQFRAIDALPSFEDQLREMTDAHPIKVLGKICHEESQRPDSRINVNSDDFKHSIHKRRVRATYTTAPVYVDGKPTDKRILAFIQHDSLNPKWEREAATNAIRQFSFTELQHRLKLAGIEPSADPITFPTKERQRENTPVVSRSGQPFDCLGTWLEVFCPYAKHRNQNPDAPALGLSAGEASRPNQIESVISQF